MVALVHHDLEFILKQIKIAEAHANGTPLTEIRLDANGRVITDRSWYTSASFDPTLPLAIPDAKTPFGLRTVDGSYNNLIEGRELWGASNQPMPRLLNPNFINEGDDSMALGGGQTVGNNDYGVVGAPTPGVNGGHSGNVADADPRLISNLVADMSFNNPAAIVAALTFAGSADVYGDLALVRAAHTTLISTIVAINADAGLDEAAKQTARDAAQAQFDLVLEAKGLEAENGSLVIPNVAADEGLSAPFNGWMTFFGQFFDHGLDLITKGGNGTIYIPLAPDDPLRTHGADGIPGTGDEVSAQNAFMVLTRATPVAGPGGDGIMGTADDTTQEAVNVTTPFVDQNQTYTSHPSHQVFLREYATVNGRTVVTGHLLDGANGGLSTWADVKAQARTMLGIELSDQDVFNVPLLRTDPYGRFIPDPTTGYAQVIVGIGADGVPNTSDDIVISGTAANPINLIAMATTPVTINGVDYFGPVRTSHAFLDDIAHNAVPGSVYDADGDPSTPGVLVVQADGDDVAGNTIATDFRGRKVAYDDEFLDAHFVTGDGRGNENIGLTAVHHVFHSEHNRQVEAQKLTILQSADMAFINEWLATDIPGLPGNFASLSALDQLAFANTLNWDGERLFQAARFATEMQYQHLVFEEFARQVQPLIDPFVFNSTTDINPSIFAEFAHTVYRFGHSMLTENISLVDANTGAQSEIGLIEAFLNPGAMNALGTADEATAAIIAGMTRVRGSEIDEFVTGALRNNLLGLPLDLPAINIARGRDAGIPTLNDARAQLYAATGSTFLEPYKNWVDFAANLKNPLSVVNFIAAYGVHASITAATTSAAKQAAAWDLVFGVLGESLSDRAARIAWLNGPAAATGVNAIDFWIGGLAEKKMPFGGMLGSTFNAVFEAQLENLQDGDRFYYLTRTQGLNFLNQLEENAFAKLIMNNSALADPGPDGIRGTGDDVIDRHLGVNVFANYDFYLEVNAAMQLGLDPLGNDPVLEGMGRGKVQRDDPLTGAVEANFLRFTGGEHASVGGTSGNDTIITDFGDDSIWGGTGNDRIESGAGVDLVNGGDGDDIITDSGDSGDFLKGEGGDDVIANSNGLDILMGGSGKDVFFVGVDDTEVFGGLGDDFILGGDAVDFLMGNEGDDWIEGGGGFDTTAGDNSELFFNSTIIGHDVMFAGSDEHDFDAESGDDIMVQGESVMRNEGMLGFDWAIHKGSAIAADSDLTKPIFTTDQADILRDRFDAVEALSGWNKDDRLWGDNRAAPTEAGNVLAGAEGDMTGHELDQAGIDRIAGLDQIITPNLMTTRPYWADSTGDVKSVFVGGNILLGGGGSDVIEGRGGDDVIDGDAWLNVRISIRDTAGAEIATINGLKDNVTLGGVTKPLSVWMLDRAIAPSQLHIVREIQHDDSGDDIAVYWDVRANYDITSNPDGSVTIFHRAQTVGAIDPATGQNRVSDGTDTIRNIEVLRFADGDVSLSPPELFLQQVIRQYADNFNTANLGASTGSAPWNPDWVEANDSGGVTTGQIRIDGGNNNVLQFTQGDGAQIQRTVELGGKLSASVAYSVDENGLDPGETVTVFFSRDGTQAAMVQIDQITGTTNNANRNITLEGPFTQNAFIRFVASGISAANETVNIDNLTVTFTESANRDYETTFIENGADQSIASGPLIVEDEQIVSARVVLTNAQAGDAFDVPVNLPGNITRTIDTSVPGQIIVTLTGNEPSIANWQAALQAVEFRNTSQNPGTVDRIIEVTVNDGFLSSQIARTTVNVMAVNDQPAGNNDTVITNVATGSFAIPEWVLLRNDVDVDGDTIAMTGLSNTNGLTGTRAGGVMTVTDTGGAGGSFVYTGNDGSGAGNATDTATVTLTRDVTGVIGGTNAANILIGNDAASAFDAAEGDDVILAGGGDDTILWNASDGQDFVDGGAGDDTFTVTGNNTAEAFVVYSRVAAQADGILGLRPETEIVVTRNGAVVAELDNIEEIIINTGLGNDTVTTRGDFNPTSLSFSTITINDGGGSDTLDITGMESAHRVVLRSNGGNDTIVGALRPQDVIELAEGKAFRDYVKTYNPDGSVRLTSGAHTVTYFGTPSLAAEGVVLPPSNRAFDLPMDEEDFSDLLQMVRDGLIRDASGLGNNVANPYLANASQPFIRLTDPYYTDGASGVRQTTLTPRQISDLISNQDNDGDGVEESAPNAFGGTALLTAFGQYFDHGLDFINKGAPGNMPIGSPSFPISAPRANIVPGTGVDPDGVPNTGDEIPAQYLNDTSPFVDQNQAYGSHEAITDLLRQWVVGPDGQPLQTAYLLKGAPDATGRANLPTLDDIRANYRIMTGGQELTAEDIANYDGTGQPLLIDFVPVYKTVPGSGPVLDLDAIGHYYVAGDGRSNENVMLLSVHTIWERNHNHWVDRLKESTNGAWTEEQYFEAARIMNVAEYQRVVFTEFAQAMAGGLDDDDEHGFEGYDPTVDASISLEFAQAAYRFDHSMQNETVSYVDTNGTTQEISLVQAFLNPATFAGIGLDALLLGAAATPHEAIDVDIVNALRNQLVGRPLDLAALNIFRGRDVGIPPFNAVREQLYAKTGDASLRPYTGWADFQARNGLSNEALQQLKAAYPDGFASMDLWVGGLSEKPRHGQLGSTFGYIFLDQLNRLQHGDRLYYLEIFDDSLFNDGQALTFSEIIMRNTGLTDLPEHIFQPNPPPPAGDDEEEEDDSTLPPGDGDDDDTSQPGGDDDDDDDDDGVDAGLPPVVVPVTPPVDQVLSGGSADDALVGGDGDDTLNGGSGDDTLTGGDGDDFLYGGSGDDVMKGGAGDDHLSGGSGDDRLDGGAGDDVLTGGSGDDVFAFGDGDRITDFKVGTDKIDLSGLGVTAASFASMVAITSAGSGASVTIGGRTLLLDGVASGSLTPTAFILDGSPGLAPPTQHEASLPTGEMGMQVPLSSMIDPDMDDFVIPHGRPFGSRISEAWPDWSPGGLKFRSLNEEPGHHIFKLFDAVMFESGRNDDDGYIFG